MRGLFKKRFHRGFTLVELMIAMALVGMLVAVIYGLFVRTSDAMSNVEGMSSALDQARFGVGQVRNDLKGAASQGTADSRRDPWVLGPDDMDGAGNWVTQGLIADWDPQSLSDVDDEGVFDTNRNQQSEFSSFVVVGAYDVPASFFVSFPQTGNLDNDPELVVESTERGMQRFLNYDPFDTGIVDGVTQDDLGDLEGYLTDVMLRRLLRVTDSRGYSQIVPIEEVSFGDSESQGAAGEITGGRAMGIEVEDLHFRTGDEPGGFEQTTEDDVSFDAAVLDAYWYHVRQDPQDPTNLQLVRRRIDATELISDPGNPADNSSLVVDDSPLFVVAENVVDFRVWFDCAQGTELALRNVNWQDEWDVDTDDCVRNGQPHRARTAHIRLSTRTDRENSNQPHLTLAGDSWQGFEQQEGQMRTFELSEATEGAASVVTVQGAVELTNFSMRNLTN